MPTFLPSFVLASLLSLCLACTRESASASMDASAQDVPAAAVHSACALTCMQPGDTLEVYRDESGAPKRLFVLGHGCVHGPAFYVDMQGTVIETIAHQMVTRGSPEEAQFRERHDNQRRGLRQTESIRCPAR